MHTHAYTHVRTVRVTKKEAMRMKRSTEFHSQKTQKALVLELLHAPTT